MDFLSTPLLRGTNNNGPDALFYYPSSCPERHRLAKSRRRLTLFRLSFFKLLLADVLLTIVLGTGGFSPNWRRYIGLNTHGYAYPFGSASFDLIIASIVRVTVLLIGLYTSRGTTLARHDSEREAEEREGLLLNGDVDVKGGRSAYDRAGRTGAGRPRRSVCGQAMYWAKRHASLLSTLVCPITMLFLTVKCFTRLIEGTGHRGLGMREALFWGSIVWALAVTLAEYRVWCGAATAADRYACIHYATVNGEDVDEALYELESGAGGGGAGGSRRGGRKGDDTGGSSVLKEGEIDAPPHKTTIGDLLELCKGEFCLIAVASFALLIAAMGNVAIPHFTGLILDNVVNDNHDDEAETDFNRNVLLLLGSAFITAVFTGLRGGVFTVVGARVNVKLRQRLFDSLMLQEIGFFDITKTGDLTSRLSSDTTKVGDQVSLNVNYFLRNFVQATGTLMFMFYVSWRLSLVAFISVPVISILSLWYGEYIRKLAKLCQESLAQANSVAEESISSMPTVRSFAAEDREKGAFAAKLQDYYELNKKEGVAYGFYASTSTLLPQLVTALVLFYGGKLVMQGQISAGKVVTFLLYLSSLSNAFDAMANIFNSFSQAMGAGDKVFELIGRRPKRRDLQILDPPVVDPNPNPSNPNASSSATYDCHQRKHKSSSTPVNAKAGGVAPRVCRGEVALKNVFFTYPARPDRPVLKDMSFSVTSGKVLALVGPSGGGKSSCVALLERFYHPDQGEVLLDGLPVEQYDHKWLHRHVSIVGQEPFLYARSIRENIIYGMEGDADEPSMEDIIAAAKLANAHDFITAFPKGYETSVGERGVSVSGGQKQRIAIARALVRKPMVLLLDEATSALDSESEHLVQGAIDSMITRGGMTVIIIAHRLSTVKGADSIVVVRDGQVVEQGTHEELLWSDGIYAKLVTRQLAGGATASSSSLSLSAQGGDGSEDGTDVTAEIEAVVDAVMENGLASIGCTGHVDGGGSGGGGGAGGGGG